MLLKILVLVGLAIYFVANKLWLFALLAIASIIPIYGLGIAFILTILLLMTAHYLTAVITSLLILWNLVGNEILKKYSKDEIVDQVVPTASELSELQTLIDYVPDYCRDYLARFRKFGKEDIEIFLVDPAIGPAMDQAILIMNREGKALKVDCVQLLKAKDYHAPVMNRINSVLDEFALTYANRKSKILEYLDSIGVQLKIPQ